jgi:hypothetical protein
MQCSGSTMSQQAQRGASPKSPVSPALRRCSLLHLSITTWLRSQLDIQPNITQTHRLEAPDMV